MRMNDFFILKYNVHEWMIVWLLNITHNNEHNYNYEICDAQSWAIVWLWNITHKNEHKYDYEI